MGKLKPHKGGLETTLGLWTYHRTRPTGHCPPHTINSAARWAGDLAKFMGAAPGTPGYRGMASGAPRRQENLVLMRMGDF